MTVDNHPVSDLVDLVRRHKAALSEAGRPDLAEHAHVCLNDDGEVWISYDKRRQAASLSDHSPETLRALEIDPVFEIDPAA